MANVDSVEYTARGGLGGSLGVMADFRRGIPRVVAIPFHLVTTTGAAPTLRLNRAPKGFKPTGIRFNCEALSTSAGIGLNISIGISTSVALLMAATDCDAAVAFTGNVPVAAYDYEFAADTDIIGTVNTAKTPATGKKIWGHIEGYINT